MGFDFSCRVVGGHFGEVSISHLLPVGKRVVEVIQDLVRLEVLLLVIDHSLETSHFGYLLKRLGESVVA